MRQIAGTGIDGIYVDIPYWMTHFDGWEDTWASFDDYTVAAFKQQTGLDAKHDLKLGDFSDPAFRKWVTFRIQTFTDFMSEIDRTAKAVNPKIKTIPEIYPGIEEEAVRVGADVYSLYAWWTRLRTNMNLAMAITWLRRASRWTGSAIRWGCIRSARSRRGKPRGF